MSESIFRQKNIDKINSPESLNDYVKVTNPSVWVVLIGVVVLMVGALIFGTFGTVDTNAKAAVSVADNVVTAYVDENDISAINEDMMVKINGTDYSIKTIPNRPVKATEVDEYVLHKANMENSAWLYPVIVEGMLEDGVYVGTIRVEQISPISYVFN